MSPSDNLRLCYHTRLRGTEAANQLTLKERDYPGLSSGPKVIAESLAQGLHMPQNRRAEVPKLGDESELQVPGYGTAVATSDLCLVVRPTPQLMAKPDP